MKYDFRAALVGALSLTALSSTAIVAPAYGNAVAADAVAAAIAANPGIVGEAIGTLQRRARDEEERRGHEAVAPVAASVAKGDPLVGHVGNPRGRHHVVEFFDYNCGFCKVFATKTVAPLLTSDPQAVVHLVQTPILGPGSVRMAEMASAAQLQGPARFRAAHDWLLTQRAATRADADALRPGLIAAARLDRASFDRVMSDGSAARLAKHGADLAARAQVNGTPAIYAGGRTFRGMTDLTTIRNALSGR